MGGFKKLFQTVSNIPELPEAESTKRQYLATRDPAPIQKGVTVTFNTNSTATFARSYITGFASAVSTFNNGTTLEFANGHLNTSHINPNVSDGNVTGVRASIADGNDNDALETKMGEWVSLFNSATQMNLLFEVSKTADSIDIYDNDTSVDIDPSTISVRTTNDIGQTIPNDFMMSVNSTAPEKILSVPSATWELFKEGAAIIDFSGFWVTVLYEYKKTGNTFTDSNGDTAIEFISQTNELFYRVKPSNTSTLFKDEVRATVNGDALDGRVR